MRTLVKICNVVAVVAALLLVYWVFAFILIQVFGLRVFRENLTQTFGLSVFGIIALMAGSLMVNVMLNLTRIADRSERVVRKEFGGGLSPKYAAGTLIALFVLIAGVLFGGDYLTSKKKEQVLVNSARSMINTNPLAFGQVARYEFSDDWIYKTQEIINRVKSQDESFPEVRLVVLDSIQGDPVYLSFGGWVQSLDEGERHERKDFLLQTSSEEREYLDGVFRNGITDYRFSASDGNYELFYPYFEGGRRVVIYFTDSQQYGKIGS
ncbi:MAG: peptidase [Acidobacteria bacterium]|nr:MAG: peptidase [Acidobacteriota bacterium]REK02009.1 MAG: peptidase [Acidobacteriota bacterium]REK14967.1 MAG: peptidase [Acidobacteriota bacterium]REK45681.1 MAG: peptidase [Acidobacteriota bacterium]